MIYGYARTSRPQQSIARQTRNILKNFPDAYLYEEAFTGTTMDRPQWNKLMKKLKSGDSIIFDAVSRMARTSDEGVECYFNLFDKGISLFFIKEPHINTDIYAENLQDKIKLMGTDEDELFKGLNNYFRKLAERQIRIAFQQAEKEVADLRKRTQEGIETARINGKQIGQKTGITLNVKKKAPAMEIIKNHSKAFGGNLNDNECAKLADISRNTYYKYKAELLCIVQRNNC